MRWRTAWPTLLVGLALAAGYGEVIARPGWLVVDGEQPSIDTNAPRGFRSVGNDLTRYYLPRWVWIRLAVERTGRVPAWDPSGFGGRPLVGNPQAGLNYPPAWPLRRWGGPSTPGWLTLGHLALGAWGAYRLARACGQRREGATLTACSFGLGPQLVAHFAEGHYPHLWAVAWYPWAFRALLDVSRGVPGATARLSVYLGLTLATGHPQEGVLLAGAVGFLGACLGRRGLWRVVAAIMLMIGLTAAEWLPVAAVAEHVAKGGGGGSSAASGYDWEPIQILQLLSPTALGRAHDYFGPGNLWESLLSFGLVTLLLAVVGARRGRPRRLVRVVVVTVLVAVVYAAGPKLGLYALMERLPILGAFRTPGRALLLATLGVALLAGYGLDRIGRHSTARRPRSRLRKFGPDPADAPEHSAAIFPAPSRVFLGWGRTAYDLGTSALVVVVLILGRAAPGPVGEGCGRLAADLVFLASLAGVTIAFSVPGRRAAIGLMLLGPSTLAWDAARLIELSPSGRFLAEDPLGTLVKRSLPDEGSRVRARDAFYTDLDAARDGVEKANVGDLFQLERPRVFVDPLLSLFSDRPRQRTAAQRRAALDRLGVAVLVSDREEPDAAWKAIGPGVWLNPSAMPRAYVVPRAIEAPNPADPLAMLAEIDPARAVVVPPGSFRGSDRPLLGPLEVIRPILPAAWNGNDPDRTIVDVQTDRPGYLVMVQAWMPGWSATIDGEPAKIVRGDHAWQVVALPVPGEHKIILTYKAPGRALGWLVSGATALALLAAVWFRRRGAAGRRGHGRSGWRPSR
jgi:hypothetical protein